MYRKIISPSVLIEIHDHIKHQLTYKLIVDNSYIIGCTISTINGYNELISIDESNAYHRFVGRSGSIRSFYNKILQSIGYFVISNKMDKPLKFFNDAVKSKILGQVIISKGPNKWFTQNDIAMRVMYMRYGT